MNNEPNEVDMKITKEEFACRVIKQLVEEGMLECPNFFGLKKHKSCVRKTDWESCRDCWKQAIEKGVEK